MSRLAREKLRDEKTIALSDLNRAQRQLADLSVAPGGAGGPSGPLPAENAFCEKDQIGESFSDWAAGELLPAYIKLKHPRLNPEQRQIGYANVFRGMCQDESIVNNQPPRFDEHPETYRRVNFLMLAQPEVRRQMGCPLDPPPGVTYCEVPDVKGSR